ncbi:branched-chain amino acid ABC transporter permease [Deinococcus sp.]|uniref:branched-chain amino acid ABC transporter permease n=1 Tax=Deinococcus sp. TaxID=47478 RepID=UPI0028698F33|nr:branched-chain amino acid ABC transporter permease [Deinococcus sp.]
MRSVARLVAALAALALLSWLGPRALPDYFVRVLTVMAINVILVASLGLSNGFTGVFSLGHVGFVALGAYSSGILTLELAKKGAYLPDLPVWLAGVQLGFLPATLLAGVLCAAVGLVVGAPLMRLNGNYVSVAMLGFLIIVNVVLVNADTLTRGARTFTGIDTSTTLPWAVGWMVLTLILLSRVAYSAFGRAMRATREDVIAAQGAGIFILPTRLGAFVIGAFFAGVGGALYAHYLGSFSPATFYFSLMVTQLAMLVVGGQGSLTGAAVGVVLVTLLSEVLRNLERGFSLGALTLPPLYGVSQVVLGMLFILVMVYRPQGLLGDAELTLVERGPDFPAARSGQEVL